MQDDNTLGDTIGDDTFIPDGAAGSANSTGPAPVDPRLGETGDAFDQAALEALLPLLRQRLREDTSALITALMGERTGDDWADRLTPFHLEIRAVLAESLARYFQRQFPQQFTAVEWQRLTRLTTTLSRLALSIMNRLYNEDDPYDPDPDLGGGIVLE